MLKLASAESGNFHNFRCGEVYCLSSTRYDISCCLCGIKVGLSEFPKHFQENHLSLGGEKKEEDRPRSPITTRAKRKNELENDPLQTNEVYIEIKAEGIDEEEISAFSWNDHFNDGEVSANEDITEMSENKQEETNQKIDIGELGAKTDTLWGTEDDEIDIGVENHEWLHEKYSYNDVPSEEDDPVDMEGVNISDIKVDIYDSDGDGWKNDSKDEIFDIQKTKDKPKIPADYITEVLKCEDCNRTFNSRIGLKIHMSMAHDRRSTNSKSKTTPKPPADYPCDQCDNKFVTERALVHHKYKHTGIFCDICGKSFSQVGNMERHRIRHTGIKTQQCTECEMSFFTDRELRAHMIRHTGIMPHICEICGKRCRDHGVLTAHMRRHTGERPAKCNICGKAFFCGYDLNVHSVTHSTERPFKCDICGSTFQLKKSLRVHKKIHSKDRNHVCKICAKSFTQSSGLHSHMRMHDAAPSNECKNKFFETGDSADDVADIAVQASSAALVNVTVAHEGSQWGLGII